MFQHCAVELVHQNINGGVHILFNGLDVEVFARQMDVCFSLLIEFSTERVMVTEMALAAWRLMRSNFSET